MVPGSTLMYGSNFWSTTLKPRLLSSIPSAAALVPLPMDDTTPPVTKIYLVSLIYTPKKRTNATPLPSPRDGIGEENPAVRRGTIPSRKPLLRNTCMDLYHTTSEARMKQRDRPALPHTARCGPVLSDYSAFSPFWACLGAATERRAPVASSPARPLPVPHSTRPGQSRHVAWRRTLRASFWLRTCFWRSAYV